MLSLDACFRQVERQHTVVQTHGDLYAIRQIKSIHDVIIDLCHCVCYADGASFLAEALKRSDCTEVLMVVISAKGHGLMFSLS